VTPPAVEIAAHAKVNLLLRVLARETTGYHTLETVFCLVELADRLTAARTATRGIDLTVDGPDLGPVEDNLAYRAAGAVLEATGHPFGIRLHLEKHIPTQAGLGGGSADAAAALHAVNALTGGAIPRHELLQFAAKLGADVTFCASGAPLALAWGRGERLFRLDPPKPAPVLIAVPPVGIATRKAYEALARGRTDPVFRGGMVLDDDAFRTWGGIGRLGGNDFESTVFAKEPAIRELFERIAETRPLLVRMTGSGSGIVAIYKSDPERDGAAMVVGEQKQRLIKTTTRSTPAPAPAALDVPNAPSTG
jgi:4-diphosphocytidyl-2-C-methyl-D-erythritol kinase